VPVARVSYGSYVASLYAAATLPAGAPYSARQCAAALQEPSEAAVRTLLRGKAPKSCGLESGPRALEHSVRAFRLHTHELRSVAQQGLHLAMQCNAMPCNAMQCHAIQCNAMPCHAMPCHAMQCHAMQCHAMPCSHVAATLSAFLLPKQSGEGAWEYCHAMRLQSMRCSPQACKVPLRITHTR
jgi:hypothetical protein